MSGLMGPTDRRLLGVAGAFRALLAMLTEYESVQLEHAPVRQLHAILLNCTATVSALLCHARTDAEVLRTALRRRSILSAPAHSSAQTTLQVEAH